MNPLYPTEEDLEQFTRIVQMNLDFAHFDFIDEHVRMFMLAPDRFNPKYMLAFLRTATHKKAMLETYNLVLGYLKTKLPASQLVGL
jgi:hypothetical protein